MNAHERQHEADDGKTEDLERVRAHSRELQRDLLGSELREKRALGHRVDQRLTSRPE